MNVKTLEEAKIIIKCLRKELAMESNKKKRISELISKHYDEVSGRCFFTKSIYELIVWLLK